MKNIYVGLFVCFNLNYSLKEKKFIFFFFNNLIMYTLFDIVNITRQSKKYLYTSNIM